MGEDRTHTPVLRTLPSVPVLFKMFLHQRAMFMVAKVEHKSKKCIDLCYECGDDALCKRIQIDNGEIDHWNYVILNIKTFCHVCHEITYRSACIL